MPLTRKQIIGIVIAGIAVLIIVGAAYVYTTQPRLAIKKITILGGLSGGGGYQFSVGVASVLNKKFPDVSVTVEATPGYIANAKQLASGYGDLGVAVSNEVYKIINRITPYTEPKKDVFVLLPIYPPLYLHFIVPADSPIKSFSDLNGKRINVLTRGTLAAELGPAILDALGIKPSEYTYMPHSEASEALRIGQIDCAVAGGIAVDYEQLSLRVPLRVLSLTNEEAQALKSKLPYLTIMDVDFSEYYKGASTSKVATPFTVLVARSDFPADDAYTIVKIIYENIDIVAQAYPPAKDAKLSDVLQLTVPLHPGAVKYYQEKGVSLPRSLLPPS